MYSADYCHYLRFNLICMLATNCTLILFMSVKRTRILPIAVTCYIDHHVTRTAYTLLWSVKVLVVD